MRGLSVRISLAILLLLAIATAAQASPSQGAVSAESLPAVIDAGHLAEIERAADAFLAAARGSENGGPVPRESDPEIKRLLDIVFDTAALRAAAPLPTGALPHLAQWTRQVVRVGNVYFLAGTGATDLHGLGAAAARLDAAGKQRLASQMRGNMVGYAPEFGRYLDAELWVAMATVGIATAHPEKYRSEKDQRGLDTLRVGLFKVLLADTGLFLIPGMGDAWRSARLPAITAVAPAAGAFLLRDQRGALRKQLLKVAANLYNPTIQKGLAAAAKSLGE
jgi:hypothetical protein